jgi:integrase
MGETTQPTAELETAVHLLLSRMLGTQNGWRSYCSRLPIAAGGGLGVSGTGPRSNYVMKRLGLEPSDLDDRWAVARANGQLLHRDLVEAFFPAKQWPLYAHFIEAGPMQAWRDFENALVCWSRGLNTDGSPRGKRLAAKTVNGYISTCHKLMRELVELHKLAVAGQVDLDPAILDGWEVQSLPAHVTAESLGAQAADTDRRAPSLRAVRRCLRELDREVEKRKKTAYGRRHMALPLRNRALLAVFLTLGGRRGAVMRLKRGDFVRFHKSDGYEGPALLLRPGKSVHQELVRVKHIPIELGEWIHEWIEYAGTHDNPDAPLWVKTPGKLDALAEHTASDLIPKLINPYLVDRHCSPHALRHLSEKLAFHAGMDWLEANRELLLTDEGISGLPTSPQQIADALLDHSFGRVQDIYKDMNSERARTHWARIAADGVWSLIWGDAGAPKGPDPELIAAAQTAVDRAEAECSRTLMELKRTETEKKVFRQRAKQMAGAGDVSRALEAMFELDDLADALLEKVTANAEAERALEHARLAFKEAKATRIALPDEEVSPALSDELDMLDVDGVAEPLPQDEPYLRPLVTLLEFHWALSGSLLISEATLRRWALGKMPYRRGDRRNPWDPPLRPGDIPDCIERPSPRKTSVNLDRLDWSRFPIEVIERLKYLQSLGEGEIFTTGLAA